MTFDGETPQFGESNPQPGSGGFDPPQPPANNPFDAVPSAPWETPAETPAPPQYSPPPPPPPGMNPPPPPGMNPPPPGMMSGQGAPYSAPGAQWTPPQQPNPQWAAPLPSGLKNHPMAIASLVLGLIGLIPCFFGVPGLIGLVLGIVGLGAINKAPQQFTGKGMAITGIVLGALETIGLILFGLLVAFGGSTTKTATSFDDTFTSTSPDNTIAVGSEQFRLGDCTSDPEESSSGMTSEDCDGPHAGEVYHVEEFPDGDYPGTVEISSQSEEICKREFEPFVGIAYDDSILEVSYLYPLETQWEQGDQELLCIALDPAGQLPAGSVRDSQR